MFLYKTPKSPICFCSSLFIKSFVRSPFSWKRQIFYWALVSALAGFLFGFDTVVISGAEKTIQSLWDLGAGMHGIAMAFCALWHSLRLSFRKLAHRPLLGHQTNSVMHRGALLLISAIGTALAPGVYIFIVARFIGGLGIGISTVAAPLYISEIAPPKFLGTSGGDVPI